MKIHIRRVHGARLPACSAFSKEGAHEKIIAYHYSTGRLGAFSHGL